MADGAEGMEAGATAASAAVTAAGAGTRPGWAEAGSAAVTGIGAEESRYVHLITRTHCHSGGLVGALHRARAIGNSAPADASPSGLRPCGGAVIELARTFRRNSSRH
jgi:hypothetical protein